MQFIFNAKTDMNEGTSFFECKSVEIIKTRDNEWMVQNTNQRYGDLCAKVCNVSGTGFGFSSFHGDPVSDEDYEELKKFACKVDIK